MDAIQVFTCNSAQSLFCLLPHPFIWWLQVPVVCTGPKSLESPLISSPIATASSVSPQWIISAASSAPICPYQHSQLDHHFPFMLLLGSYKKPRLLSPTVTALWCLVWLLLSCVSGSWNVACIYAHATSGKTGAPARAQQDWHSFKTLANLLTLFVSPALEGCAFPLFL